MRVPILRWWLRVGIGLLVAFIAIQFVPYGRDRVNPAVSAEPAWDSPATRELARQACFDCHSNETEWPTYSRVAPASWLVHRDVAEGRAELNFSEWQRVQKDAGEAAEEIFEQKMPPALYRLVHSHARLSDADRARLARGLTNTVAGSAAEGRGRR